VVSVPLILLVVCLCASVSVCDVWCVVAKRLILKLSDSITSICRELAVDSAFYPPWDDKISTSQRAVMLCGWEVKTGMVHSNCG